MPPRLLAQRQLKTHFIDKEPKPEVEARALLALCSGCGSYEACEPIRSSLRF